GPTVIGAGAGARTGFFAGDIADVATYPTAIARAHVAAHYADGTHAPCSAIVGATDASYTPTLLDLGSTLSVTVTATDTSQSAQVTGQGAGPVTDGRGNVAEATINS